LAIVFVNSAAIPFSTNSVKRIVGEIFDTLDYILNYLPLNIACLLTRVPLSNKHQNVPVFSGQTMVPKRRHRRRHSVFI